MLSLIIDELNEAMSFLWEDDHGYAYHTGKAGGIAGAIGARGFLLESLCDEISNAYELLDLAAGDSDDFDDFDPEEFEDASAYIADREGYFWSVILHLKENPDSDASHDGPAAVHIGWEEYGVALNEAVKAKEDGDGLRCALMIGFVSGLMFRDPGPRYPEGSILDAIAEGYEQDRSERVQWAQARLAAAHRLSDPTPFMGKDEYDRYMEEKLEVMRWAQNFGLHAARAGDERVAVPGSMRINHALRQQTQQDDDPGAYFNQGITKMGQGDYDGAIADFDHAIELDPSHVSAYYNRGEAKRGKGDYESAIADCDRAIAINPDDAGGYNIRGMSRWNMGDHEGAISDFDHAIAFDPDHASAYFIRGMIKQEKGDNSQAISDFDRAIELDPKDAGALNNRGYVKSHIGDYEGAITDFDRAIELDPDDGWPYTYRGYSKMNIGDHEGAIVDFNRAIEIDPNDTYSQEMRDLAKSHVEG